MKVWTLPIDWSKGYTTTYSYKTEMMRNRSGREIRRALRHKPRFSSEFSVNATDPRLSKMQAENIVVPDFVQYVDLTGGGPTVAAVPSWLKVGARVALNGKTAIVESISGLTITLNPAIPAVAGDRMFLGRVGRLKASLTASQLTNTQSTMTVQFDETPTQDARPETAYPGWLYNRREIFLGKPNWAVTPNITDTGPRELVDYGRGAVIAFAPDNIKRKTITHTFSGDLTKIREMFDRLLGMRGEFMAPTWRPDMILTGDIPHAAESITVSGRHIHDYEPSHKHVAFILNSGMLFPRRVSGFSLSGNNTTIHLTEPLPAIPKSSVFMVCWFDVWRLGTDSLKIEWLTDRHCKVELPFVSVEFEAFDAITFTSEVYGANADTSEVYAPNSFNSPAYEVLFRDDIDMDGDVQSTILKSQVYEQSPVESVNIGGEVVSISLIYPVREVSATESADISGSVQSIDLNTLINGTSITESVDIGGSVQSIDLKVVVIPAGYPAESVDIGGSVVSIALENV